MPWNSVDLEVRLQTEIAGRSSIAHATSLKNGLQLIKFLLKLDLTWMKTLMIKMSDDEQHRKKKRRNHLGMDRSTPVESSRSRSRCEERSEAKCNTVQLAVMQCNALEAMKSNDLAVR